MTRALTVGGESDSIIPPAQQRRALRIINDVNRHVQVMRRFDRRINNLYLFSDYTHPAGHKLARSEQEYKDHPVVQLLLERRDRYQRLAADLERYEEITKEPGDGSEAGRLARLNAIGAIARLRAQESRELEAMENALINIRKELTVHLHTCQKFITDMVKISQLERLLLHKIGGAASDVADDVLDAKLAEEG